MQINKCQLIYKRCYYLCSTNMIDDVDGGDDDNDDSDEDDDKENDYRGDDCDDEVMNGDE